MVVPMYRAIEKTRLPFNLVFEYKKVMKKLYIDKSYNQSWKRKDVQRFLRLEKLCYLFICNVLIIDDKNNHKSKIVSLTANSLSIMKKEYI